MNKINDIRQWVKETGYDGGWSQALRYHTDPSYKKYIQEYQREYMRSYRHTDNHIKNKKKRNECAKVYYLRNKEKILIKQREYQQTLEYKTYQKAYRERKKLEKTT